MSFAQNESGKSEKVLRSLVTAYRKELGENFLSMTLQTDISTSHADIDYAVLLRRLDGIAYAKIARINKRLERQYNITLDLFLYEKTSLRDSINPWSAEIVKRNTRVVYGDNFWDSLSYTPNQIFDGTLVYLNENRYKFKRYIKNIGRQDNEWIIAWALDHLFVTVKIYNSLCGIWSLGKKRNLEEFVKLNPKLARRAGVLYKMRHRKTDTINYLAACYALSEDIAALIRRRQRRFLKRM